MSTFGKVTANSNEADLNAAIASVETAISEGFTPNPFACKLPLGDCNGIISEKEWRKWEKNGNKGLILSLTAIFETPNGSVTDKVTCTTLEEWKSFGIGNKLSVTVENKTTKNEKFAKIKKSSVELAPELSEADRKKAELQKQLEALGN